MTKQLGNKGEDIAAAYLTKKGYRIIDQNWHCRWGEIDIVAKVGNIWIFCEVKTRRSETTQEAFINITERKRAKMLAAAQHYLQENDLDNILWRIDAIGIALPRHSPPIIDHVEDVLDW